MSSQSHPLTKKDVGSTRGTARKQDVSYDYSHQVESDIDVKSMWPGEIIDIRSNRNKYLTEGDGIRHQNSGLQALHNNAYQNECRKKKWKVIDIPASDIPSNFSHQLALSKGLITEIDYKELKNEQIERRRLAKSGF